MRSQFNLYRQHQDDMWAPAAISIVNRITEHTSRVGQTLNKVPDAVMGVLNDEPIGMNRIALETINFGSRLHDDSSDKADAKAMRESLLETANVIQ